MSEIDDSGNIMDESRFGWAEPFDTSGELKHLPPNERRAAKERRRRWQEKLRRAEEIRDKWGPEDFRREEVRIAAQIAEWERSRDAV